MGALQLADWPSLSFKKKSTKPLVPDIVLGRVVGKPWQKETLTEAELNHHMHIVGASGFGKTVLLSSIIRQKLHQGQGLLFLDLKGDIETIMKFTEEVSKAERMEEMKIFSISDPTISGNYNLVGQGTATQLRDKIMMSLNWSEEFYKNQAASFLLKLLLGFCYLRDHQKMNFTLGTILEAITKEDFLGELAPIIPDSRIKEKTALEDCYRFISQNDNYKSLQGLRTQIESLVLSDFGDMITNQENTIDLYETVTKGKILFIFLDSRRYGETAKTIGKFILQDLKMVTAKIDAEVRKEHRRHFLTIIDEFADLAQEDFLSFLDRARSSKMAIILAHQELCDLLRVSPEFMGRLMGNTATLYVFLQKRPESAEIIAKMAGTHTGWKATHQSTKLLFFDMPTGNKSLREVEEFNIHPNMIKSLRVGECIVVKKYPKSKSYKVKVTRET